MYIRYPAMTIQTWNKTKMLFPLQYSWTYLNSQTKSKSNFCCRCLTMNMSFDSGNQIKNRKRNHLPKRCFVFLTSPLDVTHCQLHSSTKCKVFFNLFYEFKFLRWIFELFLIKRSFVWIIVWLKKHTLTNNVYI